MARDYVDIGSTPCDEECAQVVRRLLIGDCPWMAMYLDLRQGTLHPVLATPQNVSRITKLREAHLIRRGDRY